MTTCIRVPIASRVYHSIIISYVSRQNCKAENCSLFTSLFFHCAFCIFIRLPIFSSFLLFLPHFSSPFFTFLFLCFCYFFPFPFYLFCSPFHSLFLPSPVHSTLLYFTFSSLLSFLFSILPFPLLPHSTLSSISYSFLFLIFRFPLFHHPCHSSSFRFSSPSSFSFPSSAACSR